MHLRAVLFDLDDTLHDKSATLRRMAELQFESGGLAALGIDSGSWSQGYVDLNNQRLEKANVFARLARSFGLPSSLEHRLLADFDANLGRYACAYAGALELLSWCKVNAVKVGIVTNGRDAFQRSKVAGMGFDELADVIVTSGGFGAKKPDPAIFRACLGHLDVRAEQAVFVGDDFAADIEPANKLGMVAIWKSADRSDACAFCHPHLSAIHAYLQGIA